MAGKTTKKSPFDCAAFYTITSKLSGKAVTGVRESQRCGVFANGKIADSGNWLRQIPAHTA